VGVTGCGSSKSANPTTAPTVSLWVSGTAKDYRQVAAGVKLALSEHGGHAGQFRVNYAGRQVSDDPARAEVDALANARTSLQDTQASAVIIDAPRDAARPAITLLNEAGISAVALGDAALKAEACSPRSDIFPAGHQTAIVVTDGAAPPAAWTTRFIHGLALVPGSRGRPGLPRRLRRRDRRRPTSPGPRRARDTAGPGARRLLSGRALAGATASATPLAALAAR
jgi:hypothetical protein